MRTIGICICVFVLGLLVAGCTPAEQSNLPAAAAVPLPSTSMKGYELYSWQEDTEWRFALLVGTNREKHAAEIQSPATMLHDADHVVATLATLEPGQDVFWRSGASLALPPEPLRQQVEHAAQERGLRLTILERR